MCIRDRVNGPVASAARQALENDNFDAIAIWISPDQETELKQNFKQSLPVFKTGDKDARQLAERYFMETAVRLHRASEGFPFTGLKSEQALSPDIEAAEKALETGNLAPVNELLSKSMREKTQKWFQNAIDAKQNKDSNVKTGRQWVDAYVKYIIYIHQLHQTIEAGPAHGVGH